MTGSRYFYPFLLYLSSRMAAQKLSCDPGETFKPYNFTCEPVQSDTGYIWFKQTNSIAACQKPICQVEPSLGSIYSAFSVSDKLILNIHDVTKDSEGKYSCQNSNHPAGPVCDLKVYARPENITCHQPNIQGNTFMVACTVNRIYPYPVCQFLWAKNGTETSIQQNINYQNLSVQGLPGYFYVSCSVTLPVQNLGLGSHEFSVRAYPNVTGQANDSMYGSSSSKTNPVVINYPTVALESCPNSYVLENTAISCTCNETSNTFLLANTTFYNGSSTLSSGPGYLNFSFSASRTTGALTCLATLLNWTSAPQNFTPKIAYGPDSVSLKVIYQDKEVSTIDWCDKSQPVILVLNCTAAGVNPGAVFQFNINGTLGTEVISSTLTYYVTTAGRLSVQCIAKNSVFGQVNITSQTTVEVTEPPRFPPIINYIVTRTQVTGPDNQLTVPEGMNRIRCRVEGGYPPVSSLSLECGSQKNSFRGNEVFVDINVTRYTESSTCSCAADHISTCYANNNTVLNLDVQFEPTVVSFQVNEGSGNITVSINSEVSFTCKAQGNPSPLLSISRKNAELSEYFNSSQKFNLTLNFKKNMTDCRDTGTYVCQAKTSNNVKQTLNNATSKGLDVYVRCVQQLDTSVSQHTVYKGQINSTIDINIPVFGYPEPTVYLHGYNQDPDGKAYTLMYMSYEPPNGKVVLRVNITSVNAFQNYSIIMTNSEGLLIYNFQIKEDDHEHTESNVGAIAGGIIAGLLVIAVAVFIVLFLRRKGYMKKNIKSRNTGTDSSKKLDLLDDKKKDPFYISTIQDVQKPHYEEITDIQTDNPPQVKYSHIRVEDVEYQNTL